MDKKVKWYRYSPCVAQRMGSGLALLFHDRGTRRGWVVSSTPWPHFTLRKDPVPILQEAGLAPGPVRTDGKSRPHRDPITDCPVRNQSLYRLSYRTHRIIWVGKPKYKEKLLCQCTFSHHTSHIEWAWNKSDSKRWDPGYRHSHGSV